MRVRRGRATVTGPTGREPDPLSSRRSNRDASFPGGHLSWPNPQRGPACRPAGHPTAPDRAVGGSGGSPRPDAPVLRQLRAGGDLPDSGAGCTSSSTTAGTCSASPATRRSRHGARAARARSARRPAAGLVAFVIAHVVGEPAVAAAIAVKEATRPRRW